MVYRHEALRATLFGAAALGALAIVVPLIGWLISGSRATALAVLGTTGLIAMLIVIGTIVLGFVAPRRRYAEDRELARWIGSRHSPIASDLLSAVELAHAPVRPGAPSPALVDALVESTERELEAIEPASLVPSQQVPRARNAAVGCP